MEIINTMKKYLKSLIGKPFTRLWLLMATVYLKLQLFLRKKKREKGQGRKDKMLHNQHKN